MTITCLLSHHHIILKIFRLLILIFTSVYTQPFPKFVHICAHPRYLRQLPKVRKINHKLSRRYMHTGKRYTFSDSCKTQICKYMHVPRCCFGETIDEDVRIIKKNLFFIKHLTPLLSHRGPFQWSEYMLLQDF